MCANTADVQESYLQFKKIIITKPHKFTIKIKLCKKLSSFKEYFFISFKNEKEILKIKLRRNHRKFLSEG